LISSISYYSGKSGKGGKGGLKKRPTFDGCLEKCYADYINPVLKGASSGKKTKMIIYNLFPLLAGQFSDWEAHFKRASEMGFNWVFLNPIQKPGDSGSLYSISDYFSFNPLFINEKSRKGPEAQVKEMIRCAKKYGLKIMIDLVINHCAFDSDLTKKHPEWFQWKGKRIVHPFCMSGRKKVVWRDLAKFNINRTKDPEGMYKFFVKVIYFLIALGFKGFRCDAAYQLPGKLWSRLIKEIKKKHPDTLFLAETLGCTADQTRTTAKAGFDYIFNSSKWWDLKGHWLMEQYNLTREVSPSISFPESHDTTRLMKDVKGNINGLKQRYLFAALFSAGVMMPLGFEYGFCKRPHVVKTRPGDWEETDTDLMWFVKKINGIKEKHRIFNEEAPTEILPCSNPNLLMFWKGSSTTKDEALIVLNKDIKKVQHFHTESLKEFVLAGAPLTDVSAEYPVDFIPEPFSYGLNPGQGLVFVTGKERRTSSVGRRTSNPAADSTP
jgi:starch synthase (maltosyl-transferring)